MLDVLAYLPAKRKTTPSGWISFNAPCCDDRRGRGGIKISDQGWSYHCFNCTTTASFTIGRPVGLRARKFLKTINVPESEIDQLTLESLRHRSIHGILDDRAKVANVLGDISFKEQDDFPPGSEIITASMTTHWNYLRQRHVPEDFPAMTAIRNDGVHWVRPHVTIPFTFDNKVVGWSSRFLDSRAPKYIHHTQPGYVFGTDLQKPDWQYAIVVEGVFDALAINGLAVLHQEINDKQIKVIRNLGREVIVVPDQDASGMALVDQAVELGWSVSMPDWQDCKDVNDAVTKYGKLATLISIMQARETSRVKIELRKRQLAKKF